MSATNRDDWYVALFAALAAELSRTHKRWLALQLAEVLAGRVSANEPFDVGASSEDAAAVASRLVREMLDQRPAAASRPVHASNVTRRARVSADTSRRDGAIEVETAKDSIRRKFDAWSAIKKGRHWYVGFARKMVEEHRSVIEERTILAWTREWERDSRRHLPGR